MSPTAGSWVGGVQRPCCFSGSSRLCLHPRTCPIELGLTTSACKTARGQDWTPGPPQEGTRPPSPMRPPKTSAQDVSSETLLGPWVLDDTGVVLSPRFPGTRMCGFQSCVLPSSQKPGALCQPRGVGGTLVVSGVSAAGTRDPLTGARVGDTERKEPTWPPARGEGPGPCPSPSSRRCSRCVSLEDGSRRVTECSRQVPRCPRGESGFCVFISSQSLLTTRICSCK